MNKAVNTSLKSARKEDPKSGTSNAKTKKKLSRERRTSSMLDLEIEQKLKHSMSLKRIDSKRGSEMLASVAEETVKPTGLFHDAREIEKMRLKMREDKERGRRSKSKGEKPMKIQAPWEINKSTESVIHEESAEGSDRFGEVLTTSLKEAIPEQHEEGDTREEQAEDEEKLKIEDIQSRMQGK